MQSPSASLPKACTALNVIDSISDPTTTTDGWLKFASIPESEWVDTVWFLSNPRGAAEEPKMIMTSNMLKVILRVRLRPITKARLIFFKNAVPMLQIAYGLNL